MRTRKLPLIGSLGLTLFMIGLVGCQTLTQLGPTAQVAPSSVGYEVQLEDLRKSFNAYDVYYSYRSYNPSAILFIFKEKQDNIRLINEWSKVKNEKDFNMMLTKLKDTINPRLSAVVPPIDDKRSKKHVLGFVYSPGYLSVRTTDKDDVYAIRSLSEQYNLLYHGGDSMPRQD
jgi:hypothetical protein